MEKSLNSQDFFIFNTEKLMREKKLSQMAISRMTGIPGPQISNYLNKKSLPSLDSVDKIAGALKVASSDLIKDPQSPPGVAQIIDLIMELLPLLARADSTRLQVVRLFLGGGSLEDAVKKANK